MGINYPDWLTPVPCISDTYAWTDSYFLNEKGYLWTRNTHSVLKCTTVKADNSRATHFDSRQLNKEDRTDKWQRNGLRLKWKQAMLDSIYVGSSSMEEDSFLEKGQFFIGSLSDYTITMVRVRACYKFLFKLDLITPDGLVENLNKSGNF